jgi:hypothetical protein
MSRPVPRVPLMVYAHLHQGDWIACRGRVIIFRMSENTATPRTLDKPIAAWKTPEARERRRQRRDLVRNYFAQATIVPGNSTQAACALLVPWDQRRFPGIGRGIRQLMSNRVSAAAVRNWRCGTSPAPLWALEILARAVGERCRIGQRIEADLLAAIDAKRARPRKPRGLEIIDEATGLPKYRNRVGRRRQSEQAIKASARRHGERRV